VWRPDDRKPQRRSSRAGPPRGSRGRVGATPIAPKEQPTPTPRRHPLCRCCSHRCLLGISRAIARQLATNTNGQPTEPRPDYATPRSGANATMTGRMLSRESERTTRHGPPRGAALLLSRAGPAPPHACFQSSLRATSARALLSQSPRRRRRFGTGDTLASTSCGIRHTEGGSCSSAPAKRERGSTV
jgi:hypothetical protein